MRMTPRLGIGTRMSRAMWPGIWQAVIGEYAERRPGPETVLPGDRLRAGRPHREHVRGVVAVRRLRGPEGHRDAARRSRRGSHNGQERPGWLGPGQECAPRGRAPLFLFHDRCLGHPRLLRAASATRGPPETCSPPTRRRDESAAARSGSATSSSRASRRERARGIHACGGLLEAVRTRAGIRPAPEVRPVPSFCYTTVGKRNAEGDFTYRERFSSLSQDFSAEDTRRVRGCLCTLAHDLFACKGAHMFRISCHPGVSVVY